MGGRTMATALENALAELEDRVSLKRRRDGAARVVERRSAEVLAEHLNGHRASGLPDVPLLSEVDEFAWRLGVDPSEVAEATMGEHAHR